MHIAYKFSKKERKRQLDSLGPRNSTDLLRRGGEKTHLGNYQRGLFLPFSNCTQMSTAPKKETNLNVKVSIINHLGGKGAPCESRQSIGTLAANKVPMHLGGCVVKGDGGRGYVGVTWPNETQSLNMCADPLMERDVNGGRH